MLEKSLDFAKEICLCVLKLDFCRIRDMKPYQSVFAPKTENMWRINNNTSENFQYSLCRLTGNQSAVDLTNLHIIWRGRSSPIIIAE